MHSISLQHINTQYKFLNNMKKQHFIAAALLCITLFTLAIWLSMRTEEILNKAPKPPMGDAIGYGTREMARAAGGLDSLIAKRHREDPVLKKYADDINISFGPMRDTGRVSTVIGCKAGVRLVQGCDKAGNILPQKFPRLVLPENPRQNIGIHTSGLIELGPQNLGYQLFEPSPPMVAQYLQYTTCIGRSIIGYNSDPTENHQIVLTDGVNTIRIDSTGNWWANDTITHSECLRISLEKIVVQNNFGLDSTRVDCDDPLPLPDLVSFGCPSDTFLYNIIADEANWCIVAGKTYLHEVGFPDGSHWLCINTTRICHSTVELSLKMRRFFNCKFKRGW